MAGQIGSQSGSIVGSTEWMVLHRPVELAALIRSWRAYLEDSSKTNPLLGKPKPLGELPKATAPHIATRVAAKFQIQ
jgi:hypothetical protein